MTSSSSAYWWQSFCGSELFESPFSAGLPNLSICMQHTILIWIPSAFTLFLTPVIFTQGQRNSKRYDPLPNSFLLISKIILTSILAGINLFVLVHNIIQSEYTADYLYPTLLVCSYVSMIFGHFVRKRCGLVTSGIQHISAMMFLVAGSSELYQRIRQGRDPDKDDNYLSLALNIAYFCYYGVLSIYTVLLCFADPRRNDIKQQPNAELDSSFVSRITLWWFNHLPWIGSKRPLTLDDLYEMNEAGTTPYLTKRFEKYWKPRMKKYRFLKKTNDSDKEVPQPSILGTLFDMFKYEFAYATCLRLTSDTLQFANPFLLHQMLNYISDPNGELWQGISYAILMFIVSEIRSVTQSTFVYMMFRMGTRAQTALIGAVYKKTLKISNSARREKTVGEIVNLMAIDCEKYLMIAPQIQQFWSCPYQITLALIYLYFTIGFAAAPGVVIMLLSLPLNIITSVVVKRWQAEQMKLKDERTKMVNEVLNGIKVVKLYAWEIPMEEHIEEIRKKELNLIKRSSLAKNIIDSYNTISPFLVAFFSFATYTLSSSENRLTPQVAFVSLSLFNQLKFPMTMIAFLINQFVQLLVSNQRLKSFFVADELDPSLVERSPAADSKYATEMENFDASWEDDEYKQTITEMSIKIPKGDLLAVVGKVGSGKSSLLSALLGEMGKLRGRVGVSGKLAYVPQQPWILNASIKDNILFGRPYNKQLYNKILYSCALLPDLEILPHGDETEVGEKGINLSGGQKARISLARAAYQDYDVYLLDDPLSAVDAHVGRHIFEKVMGPNGLLKNKTRILVTHGLTYTKLADEIIVLEEGRIVERGTYGGLMKARGAFHKFLEEYKTQKDDDDVASESSSVQDQGVEDESDRLFRIRSETKEEIEARKLIKKETVFTGGVKMAIYWVYISAASYWRSLCFIFFLCAFMGLQVARNFWLSAWSDLYTTNATDIDNGYHLAIYGAIGAVESLSFIICLVFLVLAGLSASRSLHAPLIHSVLRCPMEFFDTTPIGRILNRCAADVEIVDSSLPTNFRYMVVCFMQMIFTLIAIVIATPLFAVVILPMAITYYLLLRFYVPTSRQLKRLESVYRSPVYSHFGETIQGAASIRAFKKVDEFRVTSGQLVDRCMRCKYLNIISNRWIGVRLELIGNLVIFFSALFAVLAKEFGWADNAGTVGVSVSYALTITDIMNMAVRQMSQVESNIVSVERIEEYIDSRNEAEWEIPERQPKEGWPINGVVKFDHYSTRYRAGLDLVLREITANVSSGEKIGIVGRTGAGKSSFALALFRLIEPAGGEILIDGVDVSQIGLHSLRSALTIIPQDPVLFSGTLRFNLDPFNKRQDDEIWQALELAHLKEMASSFEKGLSHRISEGGENISVGQRQLVCLARALLRHTKILVLDEATAAVDVATDALIQTTIREQFKDSTVFTIAHRLNTILDYDRIMVLDQGRIAEFDKTSTLLENRDSLFSKMVTDSQNADSS